MRIVGGRWGGRRLEAASGREHRPTQDRIREAVFDLLGVRVPGAKVVDLYAGSGALGLEALSRGAAEALFVERSPAALRTLRANVRALEAQERARVVAGDVLAFLAGRLEIECETDLLLADPPYGTIDEAWLVSVAKAAALRWRPGALIVLETARRAADPPPAPGWERRRERTYGETRILIDEWGPFDDAEP